MNLPFSFPEWLPWWVPLVLLVPALLYGLVLLAVPFNVFGLKGRLDSIEARLDDLHSELRGVALRLPEAFAGRYEESDYAPLPGRAGPERAEDEDRPPIPPSHYIGEPGGRARAAPRGRREPRFDPR